MDFFIEKVKVEDASEMLDYVKIVGGESDNLSFGAEGLPLTVEQEREYIQSNLDAQKRVRLVAKKDGKIIGNCKISAFSRRFSHRGGLGISVLKSYWNCGIGSALMKEALRIAKTELKLEVISLGFVLIINLLFSYTKNLAFNIWERVKSILRLTIATLVPIL